jgi:hypothetical protein
MPLFKYMCSPSILKDEITYMNDRSIIIFFTTMIYHTQLFNWGSVNVNQIATSPSQDNTYQ